MIPAAVVFDCDGVLVDSEPHSVVSWMDVLAGIGHPAALADVEACTGLGFAPTYDVLNSLAPLPPAEAVRQRLLEALQRSFARGLGVFPDAVAVLDACLGAGLRVAVASASPRERLDLTLRTAGLIDRFTVSIAGDEVQRGKPAPDVYLAAADRMGADPASCVAVEDTPTGVQAAAAAGMRVVAVARPGADRALLEAAGATVVEHLTADLVLGVRLGTGDR